jgi:hypothetical protein
MNTHAYLGILDQLAAGDPFHGEAASKYVGD